MIPGDEVCELCGRAYLKVHTACTAGPIRSAMTTAQMRARFHVMRDDDDYDPRGRPLRKRSVRFTTGGGSVGPWAKYG